MSGGHPAASPPRVRVEVAVLDAAAECGDARQVAGLVLGCLGQRLTEAARIEAGLARRPRQPSRQLLNGVLADARTGVASCLEAEYLREVHLRHRLPEARFTAPEAGPGGRVYRDVRYPGLVVELDGAAHRTVRAAAADRRRDNAVVLAGERTLRFGWLEVVTDPCQVAAIVAMALGGSGIGRP